MQAKWTILSLLEWTTEYFRSKEISTPRLDAELLLAYVLEKDRIYLYTHFDKPINFQERQKYKQLVKRRAQREPYAYIIGEKEFMSLSFKVNSSVLIPRPETELIVEQAIAIAKTKSDLRVLEIGTGSGAIAVSIAYYCKNSQVFAGDISEAALNIAVANAARHQVTIDFRQSDLLAAFLGDSAFDLIVANLPYIPDHEYERLMPEVREYEPRHALVAGEDGLDLYRRMIPQTSNMLNDGGSMLLEIDCEQGEKILGLLETFPEKIVIKDYSCLDRVVMVTKSKV